MIVANDGADYERRRGRPRRATTSTLDVEGIQGGPRPYDLMDARGPLSAARRAHPFDGNGGNDSLYAGDLVRLPVRRRRGNDLLRLRAARTICFDSGPGTDTLVGGEW